MAVAVSLAAWIALLALVVGLCRTAQRGDSKLGAARNRPRDQASFAATAQPAENYVRPAQARSRAAMQAGAAREATWGEAKAAWGA